MRIVRQIFGLAMMALCIVLIWRSVEAMLFLSAQTGAFYDLLADPVFFAPLVGAGLGFAGGLLAVAGWAGAASAAWSGCAVYVLFSLAIFIMGGDMSLWFPRSVQAGLMCVLSMGISRIRRH